MKLKNSYILLIVMSIFLLISIGSVCASDAAMDADILSADDGSVDVLSDNGTNEGASPKATSVVSNDVTINEKETAKIPVTVKDNESQTVNIKTGDLNVTEGSKVIKFNYANDSVILTENLTAGNHSIIIKFLGNANYTSSQTTMKLSVIGEKIIDAANANVNSTKKAVVPIKITDGVTVYDIDKDKISLVASYKDGNNTITKAIDNFELINKALHFDYPFDVTGNLTINYAENKTLTKTITINRIYNVKIIVLNKETDYSVGNLTFQIFDIDNNLAVLPNKTISVSGMKNTTQLTWITRNSGGSMSISTNKEFTSDKNGIVTIPNEDFYPGYIFANYVYCPAGTYSLTLTGSKDVKGTNKTDIIINKASINIVINPYKEHYGSTKQVVIDVTNAKTGDGMSGVILHLYMANTTAKDYYFQTDDNGTSKINVSGLVPGDYALTVSNNDTTKKKKKSVDGKITILPTEVKMTVNVPSSIYYNTGNTATIKITNKKTGEIVPNAIVLVTIQTGSKKQNYLYQANAKGVITVNYAPAAVGSHKIIVQMADTRYDAAKVSKSYTVKKASGKISAPKVTTYYKAGKSFVIRLYNTKNKKPIYAAKLNVKIFISSSRYYNYNGQTGLDGKLRISLDTFNPGTYRVVVSQGEKKNFTAKQVTSQFVIKKASAKLTPAKVTAKKGASKYFKVTVKNTKTKKVVSSGVKIKMKVYTGKSYKTYTAKTNSKGIAQLNVKSLKVGTHKVVVSSGDKYLSAKSATSSIKITK